MFSRALTPIRTRSPSTLLSSRYSSSMRPLPNSPPRTASAPEGNPEYFRDPRPPWVYRTTGLLIWSIIPFVIGYSVFYYDFGEKDHVFMPIRRCVARQKAAFFTLSPEEQAMIRASSPPAPSPETPQDADKDAH